MAPGPFDKLRAGSAHSSRFTPVQPVGGDAAIVAKVQELIADLSPDNADLLLAFHRIQGQLGYVPREAIPLLAAAFKTTPALIYGALSFYSEVRTEPPPRLTIAWCSGPACRLKGAENIRRALEAVLGIALNGATPDKGIGLRLVQCDGTCHLAPLVRLNGKYVGPLTVSEAIELARELKGNPLPRGRGQG